MNGKEIEKRIESLEHILLSLSELYIITTKVLTKNSTLTTQERNDIDESITALADAVAVSIMSKK
jgi:hypothetical protein